MSEREALLLFCQEFQRERKFSQCSRSSTFVEVLKYTHNNLNNI